MARITKELIKACVRDKYYIGLANMFDHNKREDWPILIECILTAHSIIETDARIKKLDEMLKPKP